MQNMNSLYKFVIVERCSRYIDCSVRLYQAAFIYFWLLTKLLWFHFVPRGNKDDGISISFRALDVTLFDKALWYFSPSEVDQGRPPIKVKFEIPYFTVSGIQVTYLQNGCTFNHTRD